MKILYFKIIKKHPEIVNKTLISNKHIDDPNTVLMIMREAKQLSLSYRRNIYITAPNNNVLARVIYYPYNFSSLRSLVINLKREFDKH